MESEKQMFLNAWDREFETTMKVIKAFPAERGDYKPHERSKTAKELIWTFAAEEMVMMPGVIAGKIDFSNMPASPSTIKDALSILEKNHKEMVQKIKNMPDEELKKTMKFMVGPNKFADMRKSDILWMAVMDQIHHRGQLSVYIRLAGGKVPSIYGPTADEVWNSAPNAQAALA